MIRFINEEKNDGIISTESYNKNDLIFSELPLAKLQSLENMRDVFVCKNCMQFIGTMKMQLMLLLGIVNRQDLSHEMISCPDDCPPLFFFNSIIPCRSSCGEVFCSSECEDIYWNNNHQYLCVGLLNEEIAIEHPLYQFKIHAIQNNEIFLLVADVLSQIITKYIQLKKEKNDDHNLLLEEAKENFNGFVQNLWWDVASPPDNDNDNDNDNDEKKSDDHKDEEHNHEDHDHDHKYTPEEFKNLLIDLVDESRNLLKLAWKDMIDINENELDQLLSRDYFSRIIGMFEQNNLGIHLESPIWNILKNCLNEWDNPDIRLYLIDHIIPYLIQLEEEYGIIEYDLDDDDDDNDNENHDPDYKFINNFIKKYYPNENDLYGDQNSTSLTISESLIPPLDGTSFYKKICKMNHSCIPNSRVIYRGGYNNSPLRADVIALNNISIDDELCQSYIYPNLPYNERINGLKDYGFICQCEKCIEDQSKFN